ncbi:WD40 repeat-like protein [Mycena venus]|uniref:WD40 repeat-like protein n=1 Tax=Mycena venus TaxID=2733690 RepID=A0A8H6Y1B7_9AGAR|nr:WD40 repeat-like protein [Mycena venus]
MKAISQKHYLSMSPETLKITTVSLDPDFQGSINCQLSVNGNGAEFERLVLHSKLPKQPLRSPVVIRRGMVLTIHSTHNKQIWNKPANTTRDIAFQSILQQVLSGGEMKPIPVDGSEITLHIELGNPPHTLQYLFRLKSVDPGPVVGISIAKVNQAIPGRGFHYIGFRVDGLSMFERRLSPRAPYPQEIPLCPMFSLHPEMDLRLCLYRRPFYIWPVKSVVKYSAVKASEVHDLLHDGLAEGIEHTFEGTPEITVRLYMQKDSTVTAILDQSAKMISRRTRILERLGRSRLLMENAAKLMGTVGEMHPIAKTVLQALGQIYSKLNELENWDDKLLDLIDDMGGFLAYVEDIKCFTTIGHFQQTLETLEPIIRRTGNLVLKYSHHGLAFQSEIAEYEALQRCFERWTDQFSHGVGVENLKQIGMVHNMMEEQREFFKTHRNDVLNRIRPPETDRQQPISGCLDGTRKRIFKKIDSFLAGQTPHNILWIKGFPGSGKSCVTRSVVEKIRDTPSFGASFFFERDNGGFIAPSTMVRSVSADLCRHPLFLDALAADLEPRMIDFSTASIKDQFRRLVEKPLQSVVNDLKDGNSLVVIVDALDECGGLTRFRSQDRQDVLAAIERWSRLSPSLRLIVTSRDETPISEVLGPISESLELRLSSRQAAKDIEVFLDLELKRIGRAYCLPDWPTQDDIHALAVKAKGLFVWAATLVKFVDQPRPQDVLQLILQDEMTLEGDITNLYNLILEISFPDQQPGSKFLAEFNSFVGAIVTANRPLDKGSPLFNILGVESSTAN